VSKGAVRVLEALRRAGERPCSGEALSAQLGVSRSQVWKHVEALRQRGYTVQGDPGGGYRLVGVPDRLYPEELHAGLATRWLARDIHWQGETDSTNRVAHDLARGGAAHGTAVVAEAQSAGRGRLGRSFFSPPHQNLYLSLVLRPDLSPAEAPATALAAAVAVAECAGRSLGSTGELEIKWPNDVLVRERKVSGILVELAAEASRVVFLVLGIGVNLNVDPRDFPAEFRDAATSLAAERGARLDRAAFTRDLLATLEGVLDLQAEGGFAALRPRFDALFRMRGRTVRVAEPGGRALEGVALGVDADGALRLRLASGAEQRVLAGDVSRGTRGPVEDAAGAAGHGGGGAAAAAGGGEAR
jgi:BirA family biotin operon repressor/biotin-[acetyl-CoA-carboxylase] ligase